MARSIAALLMRTLTLVGRLVLLIVIARYLTIHEMGAYGLLDATVVTLVYFLGADFYTYLARELALAGPQDGASKIRDSLIGLALLYGLAFSAMFMLYQMGLLALGQVAWLLPITTLAHLTQEQQRVLVALRRPMRATVVLAVRNGLWPLAAAGTLIVWPEARQLETVWFAWTGGLCLALALGSRFLMDLAWRQTLRTPVQWAWLRRGFRIALPLLGASLSLRLTQTLDRYILEHVSGSEAVGIYSFFASLAASLPVLAESGIAVFLYPAAIAAYQQGDMTVFRQTLRRLVGGLLSVVVAAWLGFAMLLEPLLGLLKPEFAFATDLFWLLLAGYSIFTLEKAAHYTLYASHRDKRLVASNAYGLAASIVGYALLVPRLGAFGAAVSLLISFLVVFVVRTVSAFGVYTRA